MAVSSWQGICLALLISSIHALDLQKSGIARIKRGDVGMVFFLTVSNMGPGRCKLRAWMDKCCETIVLEHLNCGYMRLIGGEMGVIQPGETKNITLIYPNLYLHNRKGYCLVSIVSRCEEKPQEKLSARVEFDTVICPTSVPPQLKGYYEPSEAKECTSMDQDPLDECQPVNCRTKYSGKRNYFNNELQVCQELPEYLTKAEIKPNLDFSYIHEACPDEEENSKKKRPNEEIGPLLYKIRCFHGDIDNVSGLCICEDGWGSKTFELEKPNLSRRIQYLDMCDISLHTMATWNVLLLVGAGIIIILAVSLCLFWLFHLYSCMHVFAFEKHPSNESVNDRDSVFWDTVR